MALILPLCRVLLVAQNVWATYHVLKAPRTSRSRAGSQPSQRALAARKRAMKSCLAVWLVWACIWLAEGPLDATLGLVMPFYGEAKALATLGLLVFKSYAAEPIVLHLIRPAVKPYMSTIDGIIELCSLVGGLVMSVAVLPWRWWNAPPGPASATSSSGGSGSSSEDNDNEGYARRVALGDRAALHDAHRRANAVFQQLDDAQRRHRTQSQSQSHSNSQSRERAPATRHSRNSSTGSSSSVPPAPGAWTYTNAPRRPSATYTAAQTMQTQHPSTSRQTSYTHTQQPRPPSRTSQYASQPQQPVAGPSTRRSSSGSGAPNPNPNPNPYEIWYPPVPNRAPSPGSQSTQTFFYPQLNPNASQQTPPPPYESVRQPQPQPQRRASAATVPDTPHRFPGALPFPTPTPAFPVPQPYVGRGFERAPGDADLFVGGDGRPPPAAARDFIDLTADLEGSPPPPGEEKGMGLGRGKEKELPSPPLLDEDVMEIDSLPLPPPPPPAPTNKRSKSKSTTAPRTRKRAHEPDPTGAATHEELSGAESDTTNTTSSSVVKKRRVAGGRVARRVAALDSSDVKEPVPGPPAQSRKPTFAADAGRERGKGLGAPPPVAPKPARLRSTGSGSTKEKEQEKVQAADKPEKKSLFARVAPALAHQSAPPPALAHQSAPPPAAVSLSASTTTRTTRSSSKAVSVDAAVVQGMAALDAAAAGGVGATVKRAGRGRR